MPVPLLLFALALVAPVLLAACGGDDDGTSGTTPGADGGTARLDGSRPVTLRLGYFANLTHAQALVGVGTGRFQKDLGENVTLETKVFNAGPSVIEALFAGEIDVAYIGPNPAINGFQRSNGREVRIVSGSASGGALFIVRPEANIETPADLANKKFATPQLGNTQDVALRAYLKDHGLAPKEKGGNVTILPTANADTLTLFQKGAIDGAWVPEPWATRLIVEAGGRVFLDERSLWPNGEFVTTHIIVSARFLKENPDIVERLVRSHVKITQWIDANEAEAKEVVNAQIASLTGRPLPQATIDGAWKNLKFTWDPIASSLKKAADDAYDAGLLGEKPPRLEGIYALDILNKVLTELKLPEVKE